MRRRPSTTAYIVGRSVTLLHNDPVAGSLVAARAAEIGQWCIDEYRGWTRGVVRAIPPRVYRAVTFGIADAMVPGIVPHYAVRKLYIEDTVREALAAGIAQVVVLGGGFDTLATRLHEARPDRVFIELDHPATQAVKRRALARHGLPRPNLHLVPADFTRTTIDAVLRRHPAYDARHPAIFVCEGVLMYLAADAVAALFDALYQISSPGSVVAFTTMERTPDGHVQFAGASRLLDAWLGAVGEPFRWGIARADVGAFLATHGFPLRATAGAPDLRTRYLTPRRLDQLRLAEGEYVCVAARDA